MSPRTLRPFWAGDALAYRVLRRVCQPSPALWLAALLLLPAVAHAAGWWALDKGASSYARGGANIADPREPIALHLNPAGLAGVRGLQLVVDGDLTFDRRAVTRASDDLSGSGSLTVYDEVANEWRSLTPSPAIFAAYNFATFGLPGLTIGGGAWGPPRADKEFPEDGPQRYAEIESHNLQIEMGLGAGYELPWHRLRVGVTGLLIRQIIDTSLKINTFLSYPENELYDGFVHVRAVDPWIPTAIFGLSGAPIPPVTLAVSYQLAYDVHASGKAKEITLGRGIGSSAAVRGDTLAVDINLPPIFRAAVSYRHPDDSFALELAYVWEGWSRNRQIVFRPRDVTFITPAGDIPLGDIVISAYWRDTYSLRFGGEYRLLPDLLVLRAGAYYERGAVPTNRLSAFSFDLDKIGGTLGARVDLPWAGLFVNAAFGYVVWLEQTATASKVRIFNPLTDPPTPQWATGNGTYRGGQAVVMIAVGTALEL